jgi:hypothetical protein
LISPATQSRAKTGAQKVAVFQKGKMKLLLIITNMAAALALCCAASKALDEHRASANRVYKKLKEQNVLVEPENYDVAQELRGGSDGGMSFIMAVFGGGVCFANALAFAILIPLKRPPKISK